MVKVRRATSSYTNFLYAEFKVVHFTTIHVNFMYVEFQLPESLNGQIYGGVTREQG